MRTKLELISYLMMPVEEIQGSPVGFLAKENLTRLPVEGDGKMLGESTKRTVSVMKMTKVWRENLLGSEEKSLR